MHNKWLTLYNACNSTSAGHSLGRADLNPADTYIHMLSAVVCNRTVMFAMAALALNSVNSPAVSCESCSTNIRDGATEWDGNLGEGSHWSVV